MHKHQAKSRNLKQELSFEEYASMILLPCWYCGKIGYPYIGIDRIDNDKGYEEGNCAPCCMTCNYMKSDTSCVDFISQCELIVNRIIHNKK